MPNLPSPTEIIAALFDLIIDHLEPDDGQTCELIADELSIKVCHRKGSRTLAIQATVGNRPIDSFPIFHLRGNEWHIDARAVLRVAMWLEQVRAEVGQEDGDGV